MNIKPTLPQEVEPGSGHYSFRTDIKVNGWSWAAVLTSFVGEVLLLPHHQDWPAALRAVVALVPLMASLLWVRSVRQWMRGMDELQQRITMAASVFASVTTLFVVAASHLLVVAGVIPVRFQATAGFVIIWLVVCFYLLGRGIFNRRYQ
ncbi:MAG TPA: hypothetical protein VNH84_10180 [Candidatus Saccharimonadales bacterium]|nr:hypothetical protein [Candidatus Saccharimonadales bacterium]